MASFSDLGVSARVVARLTQRGIDAPFPIQAATLPDALAGRDVCGKAPTGSGKTLAFGIPLVARATGSTPSRPRGLVLVPTRELAAQVRDELVQLAEDRGQRIIAIYGGTGYTPTRRALQRGVDVVVACPGRLMDLVEQGDIRLDQVDFVVLDEADRMADMGFLPAVRKLLDATSPERQVLLFSATIGNEVESVIRQYQRDPVRHDVVGDESSAGNVVHQFWHADRQARVGLVADLIRQHGQAIVFCRTKRGADRVARQLGAAGITAVAIHGDRTQGQRERALETFNGGRADALVATDVAARGIHIDDLPCVIHYDLPAEATDYVHRSGRTGRAGNDGIVVAMVTDEHRKAAKDLQRALGLPAEIIAPGEAPLVTAPSPAAVSRRARVAAAAAAPATTTPAVAASPTADHRTTTAWAPETAGRTPEPTDQGSAGRRSESRRAPENRRGKEHGRRTENRRGHGPVTATNRRRAGHAGDSRPAKTFGPRSGDLPARGPAGGSTRNTPAVASAVPKVRGMESRGIVPVGTVKFFNTEKGYGFVSRPDGEDVFVHYSNVQGSGFRTLEAGQQVEFEIAPGRKGDEARNVKII